MTQSDNGRYLKMKYYRALNIPISPSAVTKVSSPITIRSRSPSQPVEIEFIDIEKLDSQSLPYDHEPFLPPHLWAMEEDSFSVYDYNYKKEACKHAI